MVQITNHSKERIVERTTGVRNKAEAKRIAKIAKHSGKTINDFITCEKFFKYLQNKKSQSNSCSIRIYRGNIYIWRGKNTLVTVHSIPDRFKEELEAI